ncbi:universal stress protein [Streptomyces sp. NPDC054841]
MTRHVTVGLDGSPESRAAADWAARESLLRGVPLRLVYADDWPISVAIPVTGLDVQERWGDKLLADVTDELRRSHPSLEIITRRLSGRPAAVLSIEGGEADLLVLGSRGLSGVKGFLIGSVGMATISATEQPVVLVRASKESGTEPEAGPPWAAYRDVVVGVDIHQSCEKLLAFAFDEAARRGSTLRAVYGWTFAPVLSYAPVLDLGVQQEVGREVARALGDMLMPWRQRFPSVEVVERTLVGAPAEQILYAADDADLVVVGRRIRKAPVGAHIGPVAHAVMHHSSTPVAVVAHE